MCINLYLNIVCSKNEIIAEIRFLVMCKGIDMHDQQHRNWHEL